jgi:hypothetical protein
LIEKENLMDLMQTLLNQLSGGGLTQISQQTGVDEQTAGQAVSAAVPLLISALAKNASQPDGAAALHNALQDHDGSILNNISEYLGSDTSSANGGAILGHILGDRQNMVQGALSQQTGLNAQTIGRILTMLAPVIMGALGKQQRQNGFDPGNLAGYLNAQKQQAHAAQPDMMGMLSSLLDSNQDGSVLDDIGNIAGKFF